MSEKVCKIDGCERPEMYREQGVCQMHYFRFMRNGTYELTRKRKERIENGAGYQMIYAPEHPLAMKTGHAYEHRMIAYAIYGDELPHCECGQELTWATVHIDHKDENVRNNDPANLRPLCRVCNTRRGRQEAWRDAGNAAITWNGETKTAQEWGRDERIPVAGSCIRQRLGRGWSVEDAFFRPKITHKELREEKGL